MCRCRIHHHRDMFPRADGSKVRNCLHGNLELDEYYSSTAKNLNIAVDIFRQPLGICAGNYYDAVFSAWTHFDQSHAASPFHPVHSANIYPRTAKTCTQLVAEGINAQLTDHENRITETRHRDCLICAFASGMNREVRTQNRLP